MPPSPPAGEIIKGIPPAAAKGRKRSAEQVAPAAPAKKVKESPVPAPATPAAEPSPAPPSATEETRFAMPPIPASFTAATEDQQWDRLATVRGKSAQAPTLLLSQAMVGRHPYPCLSTTLPTGHLAGGVLPRAPRRAAGASSSRTRCCGMADRERPAGRSHLAGAVAAHPAVIVVWGERVAALHLRAPRGEGPSAVRSCCRSHGKRAQGG